MHKVFFDNPPLMAGRTEDQLRALYGYLGTVSSKLNEALMTITIEQKQAEDKIRVIVTGKEADPAQSDFMRAKSLIIKNAELVRSEMEEIRATLHGEVEALSEQFGSYQQSITQEITATATGLLQEFRIEERISGVEGEVSNFIRSQSSYIYAGILDQTTQKTGIAIGEGVTDENGALVDANKVVTITSDRISFYLNGSEVAYFGNNSFYIGDGVVTSSMTMGNFMWKVFSNNSLGLMKI